MGNIGLCGGVHMETCGKGNSNDVIIKWDLYPIVTATTMTLFKMSLPSQCEWALNMGGYEPAHLTLGMSITLTDILVYQNKYAIRLFKYQHVGNVFLGNKF